LTAVARASVAFYNTKEDIDRFLIALKAVLQQLAR
jgi:selenocysteine lyase/cysteine desulfurase